MPFEQKTFHFRIRPYRKQDIEPIYRLFVEAVHHVSETDYTIHQQDAWAPVDGNLLDWQADLTSSETLVAILGDEVIGFGNFKRPGYLDRLYVEPKFQHHGVATALCERLESFADSEIVVDASLSAETFFTARGYQLVQRQVVMRRGVALQNARMVKVLA